MKYLDLSFEEIQEKLDVNAIKITKLCKSFNLATDVDIQKSIHKKIQKLQIKSFELSTSSLQKFVNS